MVDAHGAPPQLARLCVLLEPQLEHAHARRLVVRVFRPRLILGALSGFSADRSAGAAPAPVALLQRRQVARAEAHAHVPAVLGRDPQHHAVLPPRLVLRLAPAAPPPDQTRAPVAENSGGGVILIVHGFSVAPLRLRHGAAFSHVPDRALHRSRLGEVLARNGQVELTLKAC